MQFKKLIHQLSIKIKSYCVSVAARTTLLYLKKSKLAQPKTKKEKRKKEESSLGVHPILKGSLMQITEY